MDSTSQKGHVAETVFTTVNLRQCAIALRLAEAKTEGVGEELKG